ncbi:hypothetical protein QJS04_geneDACA016587 [Acorus gramineus]|uniref:Uncharacterized protein n=1 Tax=Acorus gramineus TaxID=55184 RepID=A0AAV9BNF5_ACOGR|nr:hypothetical protein QJS04_geneDACA016587 [Acorus gramineus]
MGCASSSHQFNSSVSVLRRLEEQNPAFFDVYKFRLKMKKQINIFNKLLAQQDKLLHEGSQGGGAPVPISNGFLKTPYMLDFSGILTFDDSFDDSMEWGYETKGGKFHAA